MTRQEYTRTLMRMSIRQQEEAHAEGLIIGARYRERMERACSNSQKVLATARFVAELSKSASSSAWNSYKEAKTIPQPSLIDRVRNARDIIAGKITL